MSVGCLAVAIQRHLVDNIEHMFGDAPDGADFATRS